MFSRKYPLIVYCHRQIPFRPAAIIPTVVGPEETLNGGAVCLIDTSPAADRRRRQSSLSLAFKKTFEPQSINPKAKSTLHTPTS